MQYRPPRKAYGTSLQINECSMPSRNGYFDVRSHRGELGYANRGPAWPGFFKCLCINGVHALEKVHVGKINRNRYGVGEVHFGGMQHLADIGKTLFHFIL